MLFFTQRKLFPRLCKSIRYLYLMLFDLERGMEKKDLSSQEENVDKYISKGFFRGINLRTDSWIGCSCMEAERF